MRRDVVIGIAWAALTVVIWAGWFAATAQGVRTTLAPVDLVLFRVGVPTLLLASVLWRNRAVLQALKLRDVFFVSLYGLPFSLMMATGLQHAPIAHAVTLVPGLMPVLLGALGAWLLGERLPPRRYAGFALILLAVLLVAVELGVFAGDGAQARGHLLFLACSLMLATFTLTVRRLGLPPFVATGLVGLTSTAVLLPVYLGLGLGRLAEAPPMDIAVQVVAQGVLTGFVSIYAYARAIRLLGAATAASAAALVPGTAVLIGWLVVGERPSALDGLAMAVVTIGVYLASGARFRRPTARRSLPDSG